MNVGDRIKFFRKQKALTQEEVCKMAGIGHNAVGRAEGGEPMSPGIIRAIATALGVQPEDLTTSTKLIFKMTLDKDAYFPKRAHEADAGYDLFTPRYAYLPRHGSTVIDTGVHIQIPEGFAGVLISKSGLNVNKGITSEGLIDSGYTGSIRVKLYNNSDSSYEIRPGEKVSQIVFVPIASPILMNVDALEETERGDNGFGSTGT